MIRDIVFAAACAIILSQAVMREREREREREGDRDVYTTGPTLEISVGNVIKQRTVTKDSLVSVAICVFVQHCCKRNFP